MRVEGVNITNCIPVGPCQINSQPSDFCGQDENEDVVAPVELVDDPLSRSDRRSSVQFGVAVSDLLDKLLKDLEHLARLSEE